MANLGGSDTLRATFLTLKVNQAIESHVYD